MFQIETYCRMFQKATWDVSDRNLIVVLLVKLLAY